MNMEVVCSVLPCLLQGPLDGALPLWNKGVIVCTTYARVEAPCKHCRTVTGLDHGVGHHGYLWTTPQHFSPSGKRQARTPM